MHAQHGVGVIFGQRIIDDGTKMEVFNMKRIVDQFKVRGIERLVISLHLIEHKTESGHHRQPQPTYNPKTRPHADAVVAIFGGDIL